MSWLTTFFVALFLIACSHAPDPKPDPDPQPPPGPTCPKLPRS